MKRVLLFCFLSTFIMPFRLMADPIIYQVSEGIRPNSIFSLFGDGLTGKIKIKLVETGDVLTPVQTDSGGRFVRVIMPSCRSGAYTIQVSADGGKTWLAANPNHPVTINKVDVRWTSDLRIYSGLKARLVGRNLSSAEFNGNSTTEVRLVAENGGEYIAKVDTVTPYIIIYNVPSGISAGSIYYVEVRNNASGIGSKWVRMRDYPEYTDTKITAVARPTDQLALDLGVGWAVDFNWSNVKNVKTDFGAKGDGSTDDRQTIQNAIDQVSAQGGGVIYFPNGTYLCSNTLTLKKGVILKGESKTDAIIKNTTVGYIDAVINSVSTEGLIGVANLKIINSGGCKPDFSLRLDKGGVDIFVYNNYIDMTLDRTNYANGSLGLRLYGTSNGLIKNNYLIDKQPGSPFFNNDFQVISNYFEYCDWTIEITGTNRLIYCNNTDKGIRNSATAEGPKGVYYSIYSDYAAVNTRGSYFGQNTTLQMPSNHFVFGDAGETVTDMGFNIQKIQGKVQSSTSSEINVKATDISNQPWTLPYMVKIIHGKGLGQLRFLSGYQDIGGGGYKLNVSTPWDIIPDTSSEICVARYSLNMVQEGQKVNNCNMASWLYNGAYDNVIADYISINGGGFAVTGGSKRTGDYASMDTSPSFVTIKRSTTTGPSVWSDLSSGDNGMAIGAYDVYYGNPYELGQSGYKSYGPINIGVEIRDCIIDRAGCRTGNTGFVYFKDAGITLGPLDTKPSKGEDILGVLIENVTIKNSAKGLVMYNGPIVRSTAVRALNFTNVTTPYDTTGGYKTNIIPGTPDPIQANTCNLRDPENPANPVTGLNYSYYEGNWSTLPDFTVLSPVKKGTLNTFDLTPRNKDIQYGFSYTGYVNIPSDGQYTFYTSSDDGSRLYIGNTLVTDNDGLHGTREKSGTIGLKAGKHSITVTFFQQGGGANLSVSYESPSLTKTAIPAGELYRAIPLNTLFTSQTPDNVFTDGPYELGMKFQTSDSGTVTGIKYYKASGESGSHTGRIWSVSGTVLASVAFNNESSSGWQEASLSTPLSIRAKTTYVVTVNSNTAYGASIQGLGQMITNGSLSSIADSANGVYGSIGVYPTSTYKNSNYFRDIEFVKATQWTNVSTARIYPRTGFSSRMQGGKFQGSNDNSGWTDLGSVTAAPPEGSWTTYNLTSTTTWRYLRYLSPTGGYGNISELEFYSGSTKLVGTPIGTAGSWSNAGNTKEKALDGDVSTFFDAPTGDNNYVGIDTQGTTAARIANEPGKLHTVPSSELRIYPNPAGNEVTIDSETPWIKLSILDINGKEKLIRTGYNRTEKIELNGMQPGVYIIKIQTREGIQIKKLIIY